jgi:hypothetical protein
MKILARADILPAFFTHLGPFSSNLLQPTVLFKNTFKLFGYSHPALPNFNISGDFIHQNYWYPNEAK